MKSSIYHRLKASFFFNIYGYLLKPELIKKRDAINRLYRSVFQKTNRNNSLVFDIGANQGTLTSAFLRLGKKVIAVDPDPTNQKTLKASFNFMRLNPLKVRVLPAAVSNSKGVGEFWVDSAGSAMNTLSQKWVETLKDDPNRFHTEFDFKRHIEVELTTLDSLIEEFGTPDFIKIDVEGHEREALQGLSVPVSGVSFEVNLPEFLEEGLGCVQLLHTLSSEYRFNFIESYEDGLKISSWISANEILDILPRLEASSVEVFAVIEGNRDLSR